MILLNKASNFYKRTSHEACDSEAKLEIHVGGSEGYYFFTKDNDISNCN
jgi:hypothetical protein